jgi:hypothetical protein
MTQRRVKTFDEKLNAFMKMRESGNMYIERDYAQRFDYLPPAEVHDLFVLCDKIEATALRLAKRVQDGAIDRELFQEQLTEEYPYLEEKRVARLISRSSYWAYS